MIAQLSPIIQKIDTKTSIYNIKVNNLNGDSIQLSAYKDKYILFVNVASKCGFTSQYKDLQKLYTTYQDKLMVIGVPCNQFGNQELDTSNQIQAFCEINYGVTFLMTEKLEVKGPNQHPLYQWLTKKHENGEIESSVQWNFQKYLIHPNGGLVDYYLSSTYPLNNKITQHLQ
ncbi:glutathione peroxidase [Mariniflexile sp. AS56]|uniref:glutathione peroxidase n=1 Tax=Mariniflexile sp. AS56 TaxID=3063957 RepID=UPI0026EF1FE2|nr:glutathione peroxidase [Mariniflexile sp. AS56]MDO7173217.1 glutathione peroxidase [Mariniflexile sp. AS56]